MKRIRIIALVSAILVFVSAYMFITAQSRAAGSAQAMEGQTTVVVAAVDIAPYTTLTQEMLALQPAPVQGEGAFTSIDEAVGLVSSSAIFKGEAVTARRAVQVDDPALGLAIQIEPGKRAVTIAVDAEQAVGYNLKVGDYVDVILTGALESGQVNGVDAPAGLSFSSIYGPQGPRNTAVMDEMIDEEFAVITMQNIRVLALETRLSSSGTDKASYEHITLEVTPSEAEKLVLMDSSNTIRFILRPQDDHTEVNEPRVNVMQNFG